MADLFRLGLIQPMDMVSPMLAIRASAPNVPCTITKGWEQAGISRKKGQEIARFAPSTQFISEQSLLNHGLSRCSFWRHLGRVLLECARTEKRLQRLPAPQPCQYFVSQVLPLSSITGFPSKGFKISFPVSSSRLISHQEVFWPNYFL